MKKWKVVVEKITTETAFVEVECDSHFRAEATVDAESLTFANPVVSYRKSSILIAETPMEEQVAQRLERVQQTAFDNYYASRRELLRGYRHVTALYAYWDGEWWKITTDAVVKEKPSVLITRTALRFDSAPRFMKKLSVYEKSACHYFKNHFNIHVPLWEIIEERS